MEVKGFTPILNVLTSRAPSPGLRSGDGRNCGTGERLRPLAGLDWVRKCIFLCQGAQGGRGRGTNTTTFQQHEDEEGDKEVWMSVWVDNVDEMHKRCVAAGLEITFPPTDMPWNVREMHIRHPDGHVFRVGRGFEPEK